MPHDRRTRWVLLAMVGLAGVAMSVGCMRSSNLRPSAGTLPDLSPAGELHPERGGMIPGAASPAPVGRPGPPDRDAIPPSPGPMSDPGPSPGAPVLSSTRGGTSSDVAPNAAASPAGPPRAAQAPGAAGAADGPTPAGSSPGSPAPAAEPARPGPSSTPLLDAEIRRAQAVTRQHFESLNAPEAPAPVVPAAEAPARVVDPVDTTPGRNAPPDVGETRPAEPDLDLIAPLPPLSASARAEPESAESPAKIALPAPMPVDPTGVGTATPLALPPLRRIPAAERDAAPGRSGGVVAAEGLSRTARATTPPAPAEEEPVATRDEPRAADARPTIAGPAAPGRSSAEDDRTARPPLEIASLRLCTKVKDFGQIEAVDPGALRPGQRLLVYWEMSGLEYQARGDIFVSRLAAHLELRSGTDGAVVWEHHPRAAEDVCPQRRQDYYASYPIELPRNLRPGPYRLRLVQTDLIGNRAASRELALTVVR